MTITSPCTGVCKLDDATGWCLGCGRSGDEIAGWRSFPEGLRAQVWDLVPGRLSQMGITCRRLDWTTGDILNFVQESCATGRGTWVMGVVGAVAEFSAAPDATTDVAIQGKDIVMQTKNGAMRMTINDDVRAMTFDPPDIAMPPRIVLAVKRERGRLPVAAGLKDLGTDHAALSQTTGERLFDLGLGRKEARFAVRVGSGKARAALKAASGLPVLQNLPLIAAALIAESPTRVVDTALGRIEVDGLIPTDGMTSPIGPHTHLLPDHLATGRALPLGMDLPRAYLPGAIFYPRIPPAPDN